MEFTMPAARSLPDANVRSQSYFVARTDTRCWHCGSLTRVLAIALPRDHETLAEDAQPAPADRLRPEAWQHAHVDALIFHVQRLNDDVRSRLNGISQHYRLSHQPAEHSYWANHCEHCGKVLADQELHCELDGAFVPSSNAAASNIQLQRIEEPLEAVAAGYSFEPEFFEFVRRSQS
jgi:hypothetical protein